MKPKMVDIDTMSEEDLAEHIGQAVPIDPPALGQGLDEAIARFLKTLTTRELDVLGRRVCGVPGAPGVCPSCHRKKR